MIPAGDGEEDDLLYLTLGVRSKVGEVSNGLRTTLALGDEKEVRLGSFL